MFFLHPSQAKVNVICALLCTTIIVARRCCACCWLLVLQPDSNDSKILKILSLAVLRAFTRSGRKNIIASTTNITGTNNGRHNMLLRSCAVARTLYNSSAVTFRPLSLFLFLCLLLHCSASHPLLRVFASSIPGVPSCHNNDALLIVLSAKLSFLHRSGLTDCFNWRLPARAKCTGWIAMIYVCEWFFVGI